MYLTEQDKQKHEEHQKQIEKLKEYRSILTDVRSIATLAPRVYLSNNIGTTKTVVAFPVELCPVLAKYALGLLEKEIRTIEHNIWGNESDSD